MPGCEQYTLWSDAYMECLGHHTNHLPRATNPVWQTIDD